MLFWGSPLFTNNTRQLAVKHRLPAIYYNRRFVETGGSTAYGPDESDPSWGYRRAAIFVDKILEGAKPVDLPVEQPTRFEFVINLKAAKQTGVTIPPNVLARADAVILHFTHFTAAWFSQTTEHPNRRLYLEGIFRRY